MIDAANIIPAVEALGATDVWLLLRPDAMGLSYRRDDRMIRHSIALPFGQPSSGAFEVLLDMAEEDFEAA